MEQTILKSFQDFYGQFPFMDMEQAIGFFAIYGGVTHDIELDMFEDIELSLEINFVQNFETTKELISPSYLRDTPYREMLVAIANGDGRISNIFRRAKVGEESGTKTLSMLKDAGIIELEHSRQAPLKKHHKHLLKKNLRSYRIESKVRFVKPFYRFWFGFVEKRQKEPLYRPGRGFLEHFWQHKDRINSLMFEQLSALVLEQSLGAGEVISRGSYWDHRSEFDLLFVTRVGDIVLGECKYTSRKVTRKELVKLKDKALHSGIKVDTFALFSKSGFSNELLESKDGKLKLFELDDFARLLSTPDK